MEPNTRRYEPDSRPFYLILSLLTVQDHPNYENTFDHFSQDEPAGSKPLPSTIKNGPDFIDNHSYSDNTDYGVEKTQQQNMEKAQLF